MRDVGQILQEMREVLAPADPSFLVALDSRGPEGDTPLHVALWQQDQDAALLLIDAGADVNAEGDLAETPLHVAIRQELPAVVEALVVAGAGTAAVSEFGVTPRELAERAGEPYARLLVAAGA